MACEKYFELHGTKIKPYSYKNGKLVEEPTLVTKNLFERAVALNRKEFIYSLCMKLIRKKFLITENLEMTNISGEDALLTWCMVCAAERYVLIPNITYIYRIHDESSIHGADNFKVEKRVKKWLKSLTLGFEYLDKFLLQKYFFIKNSEARYLVLDALIKEFTAYLIPIYAQIPAWQLDWLIRRELAEVKDKTALTAFLFARMNLMNVQLLRVQNLLRQQPKEAQDFQRQNEIIQRQQAQIQQLQQQLRNVHDIFR